MTSALKEYFSSIVKGGGEAATVKKIAAVRLNGARGGRPRKHGMPPGSIPLEVILEGIETSELTDQAKLDLTMWARSTARLFRFGQPWLNREEVIKVNSMIGGSWE